MRGGTLCQVKTESAKICLDFNLGGGGEWYSLPSQNSKCQDLPRFQFSGGGGGGRWYSLPSQNSKCQDLPKFQFWGEGGSVPRVGALSDFLTKFSTTPASYCITDSLSHTTYVETNNLPSAPYIMYNQDVFQFGCMDGYV